MKKKKDKKHKHAHKSTRSLILERLGFMTYVKPIGFWINTGNKGFNGAFGSEEKGLASGRIYELAGKNHGGKTLLCNFFAGLAQKQHNAFVIEIQLENSRDKNWSHRLGVDTSSKNYYLIQPKIIATVKIDKRTKKPKLDKNGKPKRGKPFLQSAEYLFQEAEEIIAWVKEREPNRPIFTFLDSVANLQTAMQVDLGTVNQNMRSNLDRAQFLAKALPRWSSLAANYDMWVFLVNQIRTKQGMVFGSRDYTPGGNALDHDTHSRVWVRKLSNGKLLKNGKQYGLKGKVVNWKNKVGGGSVPYLESGFVADWRKEKIKFKFMSIKEAKGEGE